ncbi:MAG: hypothetical protein QM770_05010 [Tepidisphaeraceae bacterium]
MSLNRVPLLSAVALLTLTATGMLAMGDAQRPNNPSSPSQPAPMMDAPALTGTPFQGPKANKGTVMLRHEAGQIVLRLSDDFVVPDTPAPHWQVVDGNGNTFLLQRLKVKGDVYHQEIKLPAYIKDVKKVQIRCAWAEVLLGESNL